MRRRLTARDLAQVAIFAALIAALGLPGTLYAFGGSVPITAQTLGVMLAGTLLGARKGALAVLTFVVLTLAGLPLLAGGRGGLGVLAGPTAGYLVGWIAGAAVVGWLSGITLPRYSLPAGLAANVLGGIVVVYALGVPVQAWRTGTGTLFSALTAAATFLPGDLIKAVVATVVSAGVFRAYPALRAAREPAGVFPGG